VMSWCVQYFKQMVVDRAGISMRSECCRGKRLIEDDVPLTMVPMTFPYGSSDVLASLLPKDFFFLDFRSAYGRSILVCTIFSQPIISRIFETPGCLYDFFFNFVTESISPDILGVSPNIHQICHFLFYWFIGYFVPGKSG
jgi:hypothetical protein